MTAEERDWDTVRTARVTGLVELGRWEQAYREVGPREETYEQLAKELKARNQLDALRRLEEMHARP